MPSLVGSEMCIRDRLISGGSDFHGKSKPGLELGTGYGKLFIPEDILIALKEKRKELFDV